jgi:hypothetical protein
LGETLRTDCPGAITSTPPAARAAVAQPAAKNLADARVETIRAAEPLPEEGNIIGFLQIAAKADFEMSDGSPASRAAILARLETIETYGQAREYLSEVAAKLKAYKAARGR